MSENIKKLDAEFDEKIRDNIRKRLIDCRVTHELTQAQLGEIVGKSKNAVASWEQGLSLPDIQTLYRLSLYYGVALEYLFGLGEERK